MGVYKRKLKKGIRWYFSGQYLGVKYHSRTIYLSKNEVLKAEREHVTVLDEEIRNPKQDMPLIVLMNSKLDELKLKKSTTYYKENCRYFKMFHECVGDVKASEVTRPQVNKFLADFSKDLLSRGKTNHKVNSCLQSLKALFFYGIRIYDLDIKNPCVGLEFYPVDKGDPYDLKVKDNSWSYILEQIGDALPRPMGTSQIVLDGLVHVVSDTGIIVIKRNEKRFWTRSLAREDADATICKRMVDTMPKEMETR